MRQASDNVIVSRVESGPILQARGLSKAFGHVQALLDADLDLYPGEVLAIVGDNGAGKSTMIKCLSGAYLPDKGQIIVDGQPAHIRSPRDAQALREWKALGVTV